MSSLWPWTSRYSLSNTGACFFGSKVSKASHTPSSLNSSSRCLESSLDSLKSEVATVLGIRHATTRWHSSRSRAAHTYRQRTTSVNKQAGHNSFGAREGQVGQVHHHDEIEIAASRVRWAGRDPNYDENRQETYTQDQEDDGSTRHLTGGAMQDILRSQSSSF